MAGRRNHESVKFFNAAHDKIKCASDTSRPIGPNDKSYSGYRGYLADTGDPNLFNRSRRIRI